MIVPMAFALNPKLNLAAIANEFSSAGRVHIPNFLAPECADALHIMLRQRNDWLQVMNSGDKLIELLRETRAEFDLDRLAALDTAVYAGARQGFQYRYETIRVPDARSDRMASPDLLAAFADWLSSDQVLQLLRQITGAHAPSFADAQATAYSPGDFLTGHDDDFPGKSRHVAYVLGLTPVWRAEWGGLLLFHETGSPCVEGLVPAFNALNLFRVPQMHSVSEVTRAAAYRRYAITGWIRSGEYS